MSNPRDDKRAEVRKLIAFYDNRGWDWTMAAEFVLGLDESRRHWLDAYWLMRRKGVQS